ncbi:zinc finger protein 264-like [Uranotaenia lowii]|uniref:zinc finger protein 264-like n=1 Tax=Uranotaenia lowii TaxID=190385 RepID=UPI0024788723|nr:zinc finger protein 264-like [Uranotaenia lowii]
MMLSEQAVILTTEDLAHTIEETIHYCYVCNTPVSNSSNGLCQLFPDLDEDDEALSPSVILANLLQIDISPELSHSQAICLGCNLLCNEYQQLIDRLDAIKLQMTVSYNSTVTKLAASLTAKELVDAEAEALDDSSISQDLVLQDSDTDIIGIQFSELTNVLQHSESTVEGHQMSETDANAAESILSKIQFIPSSSLDSILLESSSPPKSNSRSIIKVIQKAPTQPTATVTSESIDAGSMSGSLSADMDICDVPSSTIKMGQIFEDQRRIFPAKLFNENKQRTIFADSSDGNMVEIISDDHSVSDYIYENVIEEDEVSDGDGEDGETTTTDDIIIREGQAGSSSSLLSVVDGGESEEESLTRTSLENDSRPPDFILSASDDQLGQHEEVVLDSNAQILIAAANESLRRLKTKVESLFFKTSNNYYCALCSSAGGPTSAHNVKTIVIHLKTDHNEKILICEHCDKVFRKRTEYNEHLDQHVASEISGDFRCDVCSSKFGNIRALRMHRKTHVAVQKVWCCEVCQKKYSSKNLLDEHMNMHSGKRPFKCAECPKDFASKYTLSAHMKIHQDRERMYTCKVCDKGFFSQNNLIQHEKIHTGVRDFVCPECGKSFMSQHNLDIHKIVHLNYKPFICRTCGKGFARKAEIKDHERTHTGERPFVCEICDASFSQRSNLQSHKRATHFNDKRYKCDLCNRCFKRRRLLDYHIKACHTGERPYRCDICSATFVYPEHFKKHQKIHTGTKPFACEVCGKSFNSRDNRNAHRFVHSDKKPYECVTCGAGFMRKPQLYWHMQQRSHLNDKIVVNQPRITSEDMLEFDTTTDSIGDPLEYDGKDFLDENVVDVVEFMRDEYYSAGEEIEVEEEDIIGVGESNTVDNDGTTTTTTLIAMPVVSSDDGVTTHHQLQHGTAVELSESTALLAASDGSDGTTAFIDEADIIEHHRTQDGMQLVKLKITNSGLKDSITWVNFVSQ